MTITGKDMDARNGGTDKALAERGRAVDAAILAIEKQFGRGSIMKLGSAERHVECDRSGGDDLDGGALLAAEAHDRALAVRLLDVAQRDVERLVPVLLGAVACH